jgi:hypothetical protein
MMMVNLANHYVYSPKRPARPARSRATTPPRKLLSDSEIAAPSTPGLIMDDTGDVIMGAEGVLVPPSPGFFSPSSDETVTPPASPSVPTRKSKMRDALNAHTGAGVKKSTVKIKSPIRKLVEAKGATVAPGEDAVQKPFPFMKLPGGELSALLDPDTQANVLQKSGTSCIGSVSRSRSKLFSCIVHAWPLCVLAPVSIANAHLSPTSRTESSGSSSPSTGLVTTTRRRARPRPSVRPTAPSGDSPKCAGRCAPSSARSTCRSRKSGWM